MGARLALVLPLGVIEIVRECDSVDLTAAMAGGLAHVVRPGDRIALLGDLGAGKTTFVQHLAAAMGVAPGLVSSPTYVIVNQYPLPMERGGGELVHADFYRLTSAEDLEPVGWDRLTGPTSIVLAEWPARAEGALGAPGTFASIELQATGRDSRTMTIRLPDSWHGRPGVSDLVARPPTICRTTGKPVVPTAASYPFADERAKMADLNRWFTGDFTISRDLAAEDLDEEGPSGPGEV